MCLPREVHCASDVVYWKVTGLTGSTGKTKSQALEHIALQTLMSLGLLKAGKQIMYAPIYQQMSDQTARGDYRVVGVSRGHSSSAEV